MKKQFVAISILILFVVFSNSSIRVSAYCGRPKCVGNDKVAVQTVSASDSADKQTISSASPNSAFSLVLSAVRWAIGLPYFP